MHKQSFSQVTLNILHRFLDLRMLLVLLVVFLLVAAWRPQVWDLPNEAAFRVGQWLAPPVRHPPKVALLEVDAPEWALWSAGDDSGQPGLAEALTTLAEQAKVTGLVLPHPLGWFDLSSQDLAPLLQEEDQLANRVRQQIEKAQQTRELLNSNRVVLGVVGGKSAGQSALPVEQGDLQETLPVLRQWLWPLPNLQRAAVFPVAGLDYFPVLTRLEREQSLLFQKDTSVYASFALQLLYQYHARSIGEPVSEAAVWYRDSGVQLGAAGSVALSPAGAIVPRVTGYSTMGPSFARLSLAAATSRPVTNEIVLIGSRDNPLLERLASTLVALTEDVSFTQPVWFAPLNKSLLLVTAALLLILLPRVSPWGGAIGILTCTAALLVAQLSAQVVWGWWLPTADLVWLLVVGGLIVGIWHSKHARKLEAERRLHLMSVAHAQRLTELGELHQAQQTLTAFKPKNTSLQPYLALAEAFASQGEYREALKTVAVLEPPEEHEEEVRKKQAYWEERATVQSSATNLASTLVMELEGPMVLGRYEIQRELGRGATGIVYLAYDPKIARKVAIKTLNFKHFQEPQLSEIKQRFVREAAAAGRLDHPHIVSVYDVGEEQDLAYIAMDFVDGEPLSHFVTEDSLLPPFEVYRAMAHVARALHYAHQNNIIHRDIKPANIIYAAEPYQLKVTDFGIARLVDDSRTSTGEILGSPLYISPEQLQGKNVTPSADVFSLGVTFYQLLTGQLPFSGDSLASLTYDIIYGKPASVRKVRSDLPYSATRIINRAMHKDTSRRFQTALEMAEAIEKSLRRDFSKEAKAAGYAA